MMPYAQKALRSLFNSICKDADLDFASRQISNHSGCKISVQVLKKLVYSDTVVISITQHKTQQELAAYEQPNTVMQQGISGFSDMLKIGQLDCHKTVTNQQEFATQTNTLPKSIQQKILTESSLANISVTESNQINNTNPQERNEILNKFLYGNFQNCIIHLHF
ncbi:hypothetical protein C2G38_2207994 [Gigaspora rosea]|uniref:Uncharacterized protein n=1 Tax=Gigaspora rosea TaxID=44941 RepID=A0A397UHI4_9GLOM|nr:hypothetical protein C2G38_2207994 [Gigaspora rosea]